MLLLLLHCNNTCKVRNKCLGLDKSEN
uniref:Uncharacterized protein n=1 Tax=Rhizophora mucronata TaxID=61149 RepID=A0A2P2N8E8_RHIMU